MERNSTTVWLTTLLFPYSALAGENAVPSSNTIISPLPEAVGTGMVLQVFFALLLVLLLIGIGAWLLRRMGGLGLHNGGAMQVLSAVSIGQHERVVLMQVGDVQLLLGVAAGQVRTLHVFNEPVIDASAGHTARESFAERLQTVLGRGKGQSKE